MKLLDRLCLFIVNTVFAMQFNSPLLISQDDLLVACSWVLAGMPEDRNIAKTATSGSQPTILSWFEWHGNRHQPRSIGAAPYQISTLQVDTWHYRQSYGSWHLDTVVDIEFSFVIDSDPDYEPGYANHKRLLDQTD
jgi:hypothetical protein